MIQVLLGKKIEQTQKFLIDGTRIPVTEISIPDNAVVQVKTLEKDKYTAIQIGIGKKKSPTKALLGHVKKNNLTFVPSRITEIRIDNKNTENMPKSGDFLKIEEVFKPGDMVDVTGISKGKGFAGVVKRHQFKGGPKTHGQSDRERAPGSIGQTTTPGRVYKGKRMAGHMGHERVTIKNLKVVGVDEIKKILYVAGLIPGVKNSIVEITRVGENKKFIPLYASMPQEAEAKAEVKPVEKKETKEAKPAEKTQEVKEEKKGEK
ncbi:50S ribosomal protein L3 [Patescibacteria group bacterium]|nr:50S ribosomal protein L3 [Patescibacteria group bacterium]